MYHHVVVFSPHGGGFSPHGGGFFRDLFYFPPMVGAEFSTTHHGAESWLPNRWWFPPTTMGGGKPPMPRLSIRNVF